MPLDFPFDWQRPDYTAVLERRAERIQRLRKQPELRHALLARYKWDPAQMIIDWGITSDPRNIELGLPVTMPFLLFPHQEELVNWMVERWRNQENGIGEKTREMGFSWIVMATLCCLSICHNGFVGGVGSRKKEYVDQLNNPKGLFWKGRMFMDGLPAELRAGYNAKTCCPEMKLIFPDTGSFIGGEVGDDIGRGNRTSLYVIDEAAFLEHPEMADFALSRTTNCRIDISTPNGMGNPFAQRRWSGNTKVFTYHWRHDPRKNQQWYDDQVKKIDNPLVVACELDISYANSIEGLLIPTDWFNAAIDAHIKLGIEITGARKAGFDVADEGVDKNALAGRRGILLEYLEEWSGKGGDIYRSVEKVMGICESRGYESFVYDADGLGAGCRGDARQINMARRGQGKPAIRDAAFHGSGAVWQPDEEFRGGNSSVSAQTKRTNKDYFANLKAQSWFSLRLRFQATYRAVVEKLPFDKDDLISISSNLSNLTALQMQMQQPTYSINGVGKLLVDKMPDGMKSPNLADCVMIAFNPSTRSMDVWAALGKAAIQHRGSLAASREMH
jgi:phage terminase large subunit